MALLNPYIHFKNNTREAMEFYKTVFGGTLTLSTFKEANAPVPETEAHLIMHSMLVGDNGITFMAADTPSHMTPHQPGANISMSLSGENETELRGYWDKLTKGSTIAVPLAKSPWGDTFGMFTDKFGIEWFVNITAKKS